MQNEPSLEQIDDYSGHESKEKKNTVRLVVLLCIVVGALYGFAKYNFNSVDDYIGTKQDPGLNTSKSF